MSNILSEFIEANLTKAKAEEKAEGKEKTVLGSSQPGKLAITGSVEWSMSLSTLDKSPNFLEAPQVFDLPYDVKDVFTSSSSLHTFIVGTADALYAFGMHYYY